MNLKELIKHSDICPGSKLSVDFPVKGISCDSRRTRADFVFVAIKGAKEDGSKFIAEAIKKGARAIVVKSQVITHKRIPTPPIASGASHTSQDDVVFIEVEDDRKALAQLACAFYGNPSQKLKTVGITGTNGKTTITYLIEAVLKNCGQVPGVIGTVNCRFKDKVFPSLNTTPGPLELQAVLAEMLSSGVTYSVMEVSSHALDQGRVALINFSAAIFTNLTQDHLDYHKNLEEYFLAKSKLFCGLSDNALSIINSDDHYGLRLKKLSGGKVITYGIDSDCDVKAADLRMDQSSSGFLLQSKTWKGQIKTGLIGRHNVYNLLAAFAWALGEGLEPAKVKAALEGFSYVPGRLERFSSGSGFSVFVDYAHTEDALKNVLNALKAIKHNRIIVVFGCGGERDKTKRPKMGNVVSEMADYAIITNDNPRSEDPAQIIEDIKAGINKNNFCVIPERLEAIRRSLSLASAGDIVLVAGKGHEDYQVLKDKTLHFDDREAVRQCLQSMS
jgi:UDP-N-acetylmuramoyl-L-alanyl-D-glutamate--2,6-diaminopimelate ligase